MDDWTKIKRHKNRVIKFQRQVIEIEILSLYLRSLDRFPSFPSGIHFKALYLLRILVRQYRVVRSTHIWQKIFSLFPIKAQILRQPWCKFKCLCSHRPNCRNTHRKMCKSRWKAQIMLLNPFTFPVPIVKTANPSSVSENHGAMAWVSRTINWSIDRLSIQLNRWGSMRSILFHR